MGHRRYRLVRKISPIEARIRLKNERGIVLLDVRTPGEYFAKHIPGSVLIPLDVLSKMVESRIPDKNTTIFVYCGSGKRSAEAAGILDSYGYVNVYNLGGIQEWPYETISGM